MACQPRRARLPQRRANNWAEAVITGQRPRLLLHRRCRPALAGSRRRSEVARSWKLAAVGAAKSRARGHALTSVVVSRSTRAHSRSSRMCSKCTKLPSQRRRINRGKRPTAAAAHPHGGQEGAQVRHRQIGHARRRERREWPNGKSIVASCIRCGLRARWPLRAVQVCQHRGERRKLRRDGAGQRIAGHQPVRSHGGSGGSPGMSPGQKSEHRATSDRSCWR
jgi:hypothetical protein